MNTPDDILDIMLDELAGHAGEEQQRRLRAWLEASPARREEWKRLCTLWYSAVAGHRGTAEEAWACVLERVARLERRRHAARRLVTGVAATVALVAAGAGLLWLSSPGVGSGDDLAAWLAGRRPKSVELLAGDGHPVTLGSAGQREGSVLIAGDSAGVSYHAVGGETMADDTALHVLTVPRGGEFRLTLSDGTEVTLNAATTLRFPARFTGDRREVWLAGEAYFRVTADASRPFTVRANGTVTTALGTEFNVMAYPDDRSTGITLVSGAVEVVAGGKPERLSPGYQLDVDNATGETRRERVDAATMTAWHTGIFRFDNIPLVELMHRVERWCDVPFRFRGEGLEGKVFTGGFRRYEPLERILRMIGEVNDVTFRLENDTILIDNK